MELTWNIPQELKDSEVVKQAVKLAKQMICTKHCARIMLLYNCEEVKSQEGKIKVEDVLCEFASEPIEIKFSDIDAYGLFRRREPNTINIDNNLKDLILERKLKKGDPGFNRMVFFVAIVIVHECTHFKHYHFLENKGSVKFLDAEESAEDGEEFETQLLGGVLQFCYTSLDLYITTSGDEKFSYSSPQAESMIRDLSMKKVIESKQSANVTPVCPPSLSKANQAKKRTEHFEPLIPLSQLKKITTSTPKLVKMKLKNTLTTYNKGKVDIQAELTNLSDVNVSVPQNYVAHYFHVQILDLKDSIVNDWLPTDRFKAKPLDQIEPKVKLAPNQSYTFPLFSLNSICSELEECYSNNDWKLQTQFKGDILCEETKNVYVLESNVCVDELIFTSSSDKDTYAFSVPIPHKLPISFLIKSLKSG